MNLTALRELAYRPAPEPFTGTWSAIVWQPELSGVQRFVVGVVVRGQGQQAARLMSEPGRLECFFRPRSIAADFTWLISMARSCDIPVYEYCYLAGLVDGMHLKETLEQLKTP